MPGESAEFKQAANGAADATISTKES
ncbi:hypothetical protein NTGBS_550013 [Candidatus Nitrotoga sp. BS]|nr:hypothetical protein NTGBS_550013 [Candidatus Nitrotoga sp. BS]